MNLQKTICLTEKKSKLFLGWLAGGEIYFYDWKKYGFLLWATNAKPSSPLLFLASFAENDLLLYI